jgi:hypothetical protein
MILVPCAGAATKATRELAALPEVGDGVLHRTIALIQRQYWDPPQFGRTAGWHKYK